MIAVMTLSFRSRDDQHVIHLHIHRPGRYAVQAQKVGTRFYFVARAEETRVWSALRRVANWRRMPPSKEATDDLRTMP